MKYVVPWIIINLILINIKNTLNLFCKMCYWYKKNYCERDFIRKFRDWLTKKFEDIPFFYCDNDQKNVESLIFSK